MNTDDTLQSSNGKYKIIRKLSNGTFGDVYLADYTPNNSSTSVKVAIKDIARYCTDIEKCKREADLMETISKSCTSKHVVQYIDAFIGEVTPAGWVAWIRGHKSPSNGNLFITMNYCTGGDLRSKIKRKIISKSQFDIRVIYKYMYQIADGIDELHTKHKIVHRDLKPANVLVAIEGDKEVLKISDLGLAKLLNYTTVSQNYPNNKHYGTPFYWAPEQDEGNKCRFPVDIWAIGIIFYELCIAPTSLDYALNEDLRNKVDNRQQVVLPQRFRN